MPSVQQLHLAGPVFQGPPPVWQGGRPTIPLCALVTHSTAQDVLKTCMLK